MANETFIRRLMVEKELAEINDLINAIEAYRVAVYGPFIGSNNENNLKITMYSLAVRRRKQLIKRLEAIDKAGQYTNEHEDSPYEYSDESINRRAFPEYEHELPF
jgi:hypothetical protein